MTTHVRPSECDRCVPVERITTSSGLSWIVETAHQAECPNAPKGATK